MSAILNYKDSTTGELYKPLNNNYISKGVDKYEVKKRTLPHVVTKKRIEGDLDGSDGRRHKIVWQEYKGLTNWSGQSQTGNKIIYSHKAPGTYLDLEITSFVDDHIVKEYKAYDRYGMRHIQGESFTLLGDYNYHRQGNFFYHRSPAFQGNAYSFYIENPILKIKDAAGVVTTHLIDYTLEGTGNKTLLTLDFRSVGSYVKTAFDNNCQWVSVMHIIRSAISLNEHDYTTGDVLDDQRSTGTDDRLNELPSTNYYYATKGRFLPLLVYQFIWEFTPSKYGADLSTVQGRHKINGIWTAWYDLSDFYTNKDLINAVKDSYIKSTVYKMMPIIPGIFNGTEVQIRYDDDKGTRHTSNISTNIGQL